jgi:peroxiredoxin
MIKVGDKLPSVVLYEWNDVEGEGCAIGPKSIDLTSELANKTVALFGLPGAFTPTCSASHVPGYIAHYDEFKSAGVDEIWCVSVNDAFVMGAWAKDQQTGSKVRMIADGSASFAKATGITLDLTDKGLGLRSGRYSMLVKNGVVVLLNVESGGELKVSDAKSLLSGIKAI